MITRVRRSEKLSPEEHTAFIKWVDSQDTKIDAAEKVGIVRQNLARIYAIGSGKPSTLKAIRKLLKKTA